MFHEHKKTFAAHLDVPFVASVITHFKCQYSRSHSTAAAIDLHFGLFLTDSRKIMISSAAQQLSNDCYPT